MPHSSYEPLRTPGTRPEISQFPISPLVYDRSDGTKLAALPHEIIVSETVVNIATGAGSTEIFCTAEIVRRLHAEGMNVALHYRTSGKDARRLRDELNAERPASVEILEADLRDSAALREMDGAGCSIVRSTELRD